MHVKMDFNKLRKTQGLLTNAKVELKNTRSWGKPKGSDTGLGVASIDF